MPLTNWDLKEIGLNVVNFRPSFTSSSCLIYWKRKEGSHIRVKRMARVIEVNKNKELVSSKPFHIFLLLDHRQPWLPLLILPIKASLKICFFAFLPNLESKEDCPSMMLGRQCNTQTLTLVSVCYILAKKWALLNQQCPLFSYQLNESALYNTYAQC